jgi:hypothetical protein
MTTQEKLVFALIAAAFFYFSYRAFRVDPPPNHWNENYVYVKRDNYGHETRMDGKELHAGEVKAAESNPIGGCIWGGLGVGMLVLIVKRSIA